MEFIRAELQELKNSKLNKDDGDKALEQKRIFLDTQKQLEKGRAKNKAKDEEADLAERLRELEPRLD